MDNTEKTEKAAQIASLLSSAKTAHITYETEDLKGEYDEEWAQWYAQYLLDHGLLDLFEDATARDRLKKDLPQLLSEADASHRTRFPDETWPDYYGVFLVEALASEEPKS